ncbi:MAG: SMI1/KNR4 family protein [Clostridia bacterium]|nr:SMI1/KNR4 family protein [Clostridia bacterium]
MKKDKKFYVNLALIIAAIVFAVAGVLLVVIPDSSRLAMFGYACICLGAYFFLMWLMRVIALRSVNQEKRESEKQARTKEKEREEQARAKRRESEKQISIALNKFESATDIHQTDTVKLVDAGMEFYAEGRYVCEKDFKGVSGHHLAFEIRSTRLKHKPEDYDDVCDYESNGVYITIGYHDGEALEKYANDNGVILKDAPEDSVGKTVTLKPDSGYVAYVWTADGDEIDYGFVKILKCEKDVLTIRFSLNVSCGLCDTVEGVVELKKEVGEDAQDIQSLINRIKWKRYNVIEVSAEEVAAIKRAHPFLPESYIEFLSKVGFADMDWIDIGFDNKTPTNLGDSAVKFMQDVLAEHDDYNVNDYYFIAVDSGDGYYAFSRNPDDKKVYNFSYEDPYIFTYESFEKFLAEILNT